MRCYWCLGSGYVIDFWEVTYPCPKCDGAGLEHCCEGLKEQPEEDQDDANQPQPTTE